MTFLGLYYSVPHAFRQHFLLRWVSGHAVCQPKAADLLEYEEESAGEQDEPQSERQHAALTRHDYASVTAKAVFPGKHLPFSPDSFGLVLGQRSRRRRRERLRIYLLIFAVLHPSRRSASIKHQLLRGEMSRNGVIPRPRPTRTDRNPIGARRNATDLPARDVTRCAAATSQTRPRYMLQ